MDQFTGESKHNDLKAEFS